MTKQLRRMFWELMNVGCSKFEIQSISGLSLLSETCEMMGSRRTCQSNLILWKLAYNLSELLWCTHSDKCVRGWHKHTKFFKFQILKSKQLFLFYKRDDNLMACDNLSNFTGCPRKKRARNIPANMLLYKNHFTQSCLIYISNCHIVYLSSANKQK